MALNFRDWIARLLLPLLLLVLSALHGKAANHAALASHLNYKSQLWAKAQGDDRSHATAEYIRTAANQLWEVANYTSLILLVFTIAYLFFAREPRSFRVTIFMIVLLTNVAATLIAPLY